jgi:capsular polysaccharide biosynthesis protein
MNPFVDGSSPAAVGRFVSVPALVRALRRRWRLWTAGAVLAAVAAVGFSLASPPEHTATTILLLQHPSGSNEARAMLTDARLLESRTVAQAAIDSLGLRLSAREMVEQYRPTILSDDLLQIKVTAPSDAEAVRRAEAVADAFLAFRRDEIQRQSAVALENLEERQTELNAELVTVNEGITARTGQRNDEALRVLGDLLVRRASLNDKLGGVRQRIEAATFDTDSIIEKTRVVDPAGPDRRQPVKAAAVNLVAGVILGLLLTMGLIVLQEATSDRLRRREDVAVAMGVPVAPVDLRAVRGPLWLQRRRFARLLANPTPDVIRTAGHLRQVLEQAAPPKALVVVSADSDGAAALALAATALRLTREERSVLVVDLTRRNVLARLTREQPEAADRLPLVGNASALWVSIPPDQAPELDRVQMSDVHRELASRVDVVLALATIDPAIGAQHLCDVASNAVIVATAGRTSETGLRSIAHMLQAAGIWAHSTILVGADGDDDSVGLAAGLPIPGSPVMPRVGASL